MNKTPASATPASATAASAMRLFAHATALLLVLSLAACGVLPKKVNIDVYAPHVTVAPDAGWPTVHWQLLVARPSANKLLDSSHIVVSPTPDMLQVYYAASWTDSVPDVLQNIVTRAFEDSGKITAVAEQSTALRADYLLVLDIRHFEAVYAMPKSPPTIRIDVAAKLIDSNGRVVAAHTFNQSEVAADTAVPAVIDAFDRALAPIAHDLVGWTLVSGQQEQAANK